MVLKLPAAWPNPAVHRTLRDKAAQRPVTSTLAHTNFQRRKFINVLPSTHPLILGYYFGKTSQRVKGGLLENTNLNSEENVHSSDTA